MLTADFQDTPHAPRASDYGSSYNKTLVITPTNITPRLSPSHLDNVICLRQPATRRLLYQSRWVYACQSTPNLVQTRYKSVVRLLHIHTHPKSFTVPYACQSRHPILPLGPSRPSNLTSHPRQQAPTSHPISLPIDNRSSSCCNSTDPLLLATHPPTPPHPHEQYQP